MQKKRFDLLVGNECQRTNNKVNSLCFKKRNNDGYFVCIIYLKRAK